MERSESIKEVAQALSKLQGEVTDAHKGRQGYGYRYADLSGVLDIARPLCLKYELSVTQLCCSDESGNVGVETILMHSSGEYIGSKMMMPLTAGGQKNGAQSAGSVITYARRYALAAILGITQTDDDASAKEPALTRGDDVDIKTKIRSFVTEQNIDRDFVCTEIKSLGGATLDDLSDSKLKQLAKKIGAE